MKDVCAKLGSLGGHLDRMFKSQKWVEVEYHSTDEHSSKKVSGTEYG